jgi:hypothetical protein
MNRLLRLILVIFLLISCSGCFIPGRGWIVPGGEFPGDQNRGDHGDRDRGGHGDRDSGRHNEQERH